MRRYMVIFGALLLALVAANPLSAQKKRDYNVDAVLAVANGREFTIDVRQATPTAGRTVQLTPSYTMRVNDDSVTIQLPYYGRGYNMGYTSDGSLRFTSLIRDYNVSEGRKGAVKVYLSTEEMGETFDIQLTLYSNGTAYIQLRSDKRQQISYSGSFSVE